jgi:carbonic anhydrase
MRQWAMCQCCGVASHSLSRRALFGGGLAALALARSASSRLALAAPDAAVPGIPGDMALKRIMAGNAGYVANRPTQHDFGAGRAERLANGKVTLV